MLSIPEIATQIIDKAPASIADNSRTIFLVGSRFVVVDVPSQVDSPEAINIVQTLLTNNYVLDPMVMKGKTTLLYSFLDKNDTPRQTLVLEYSFGRKSNQKQGIEKTICHVWEYGGKLDLLPNIIRSIPITAKYYYCIMIDLSKIKSIWNTLENCLKAVVDSESISSIELLLLCGKYDLFRNYDADIKKFICNTLRSVALLQNAYLMFYSSKEPQLAKRAKEMLQGIGFGSGMPVRDKNTNFTKPLVIPKGTDSWDNIGIPPASFEQIKARHLSRIAPDAEIISSDTAEGPLRTHLEPLLDVKLATKYDELRNLETLDISLNDYLLNLR